VQLEVRGSETEAVIVRRGEEDRESRKHVPMPYLHSCDSKISEFVPRPCRQRKRIFLGRALAWLSEAIMDKKIDLTSYNDLAKKTREVFEPTTVSGGHTK
jgi:hypothetical protein